MRFLDILWIGLGGFLGTILRYGIGVACQSSAGVHGFPIATWVVNTAGCFLMGILQGAALKSGFSKEISLVLGVGVLGGFTTFSAFGWDWMRLMQANRHAMAVGYVLVTLGCGFVAVYAGLMLGGRLASSR